MPRIPRTFRLHAKNIFLTYPHCSLSKQDALDQILCIECPSNKKFIRVTRELHENGEPRIHMLIQFEGKIQLCNARHFDLRHVSNSSTFHPNIQGAKSSSDIKSYIGKDGDYIEWGHFQIDGRSSRGGALAANDAYASALNTAMANEGEMKGDKLVLRGLKFHGYHGVKEEENKLGQKFVIDVDAWMNLGPAGISDSLSDTISYTDIYRIVKGVVEGTPRKLLETVAQLIASETLAKHPRISAVRVQVQKPHVSVPGSIDFLGVEITRYRSTDSPK